MADRMFWPSTVGYLLGLWWLIAELQGPPPAVPSTRTDTTETPALHFDLPAANRNPSIDTEGLAARPLFSPNRRPPEANRAPIAKDPPTPEYSRQLDGYRLSAVLTVADRPAALIEDDHGQTHLLHEGDQLKNWTLASIADAHITLRAGEKFMIWQVHDYESNANRVDLLQSNSHLVGRRLGTRNNVYRAAPRTATAKLKVPDRNSPTASSQ